MSNKFSTKGPAYVLPPWCTAPPIFPLPPVPPYVFLMQATGIIRWRYTGNYVYEWCMHARDIPKTTATLYSKEVVIGSDRMRFEINVAGGKITSAGLTAIRGFVFQATISWTPIAIYSWPSWQDHWFLFPEFGLPADHGGSLHIWL